MTIILLTAVLILAVNLFGTAALAGLLTNAIGAPVNVGRLEVGLLSTHLGIKNLKIQNPQGFREETLAEIHEMSVDYDLAALLRGKVHLKKIVLNFDTVTIEKNGGSQVNLLELGAVKGLTQGIGSGGGGKVKPQKTPGTKTGVKKTMPLQIDEVLANIGKTRYVDSAAQPSMVKDYDLGIHDESFKNITNASDLVKNMAYLVLRKVGLASLTGNLDLLMKGVGGGLESTFHDLKGKFLK